MGGWVAKENMTHHGEVGYLSLHVPSWKGIFFPVWIRREKKKMSGSGSSPFWEQTIVDDPLIPGPQIDGHRAPPHCITGAQAQVFGSPEEKLGEQALTHPWDLSPFLFLPPPPFNPMCWNLFFPLKVKAQILPALRIPPDPLKMELIVPPQCFNKTYSCCQTIPCREYSMASVALLV